MIRFKQEQLQTFKQRLKLESQYLKSCFPLTETFIFENKEKILCCREWNIKHGKFRYQSIMDIVFCNLYPYYVKFCKKFYTGTGKQLNDFIGEHYLHFLDKEMRETLKELIEALEN